MINKLVKFTIGLFLFLLIVITAIFGNKGGGGGFPEKAKVPEKISRWRPIVEQYCEKYKCSNYVDFLLALMDQEIGETDTPDVMQSSECINLPANSIQDPVQSIDVGVKNFKNVLDYGKKYTKALTESFSTKEATENGWSSYGDVDYVQHVMSKVEGNTNGTSSTEGTGAILSDADYNKLMQASTKYEGQPYVFGGNSPSTGFDCSGIVQYAFSQIGIKLSRTAQNQYDQSTKVSANEAKPGDLVFFKGTYNCPDYITHVGIFVGNNKMYQSGSSGIGYADLNKSYYQEHLVGFGRVTR